MQRPAVAPAGDLGFSAAGRIYVRALRVRQVIAQAYAQLFSTVDVLLTPAAPFATYRLDAKNAGPVSQGGESMTGLVTFSGPFDLIGLPAITTPIATTADGLPIGVQFVGQAFAERQLYQIAHAFEQAAAGWRLSLEVGNYVV